VVNLSAPIGAHQVEILRWIADGCPDGVMTGYSYKTTAKALQGRRLVTAGVQGGAWRAELTDAGRHYLEHGCYPPGLCREPPSRDGRPVGAARDRFTAARSPAVARPPGPPEPAGPAARVRTIDELAAELVARVVAAGGVLDVDASLAGDVGKRLMAAARHAPGLPFGKQLQLRSRGMLSRVREVYLDEDFSVRVSEQPVPVPRRVTWLHPAVAAYRDDADRHEVSRDSLSRATRILHALASEAQRRGHDVTAVRPGRCQYNSDFIRSLKDGQLAIGIDGFRYTIRIREQQGPGGAPVPMAETAAGGCRAGAPPAPPRSSRPAACGSSSSTATAAMPGQPSSVTPRPARWKTGCPRWCGSWRSAPWKTASGGRKSSARPKTSAAAGSKPWSAPATTSGRQPSPPNWPGSCSGGASQRKSTSTLPGCAPSSRTQASSSPPEHGNGPTGSAATGRKSTHFAARRSCPQSTTPHPKTSGHS
jgi:hypothetical protein